MDRNKTYLLDILNSAELIANYVAGIKRDTFLDTIEIQDAVIRRLEIIGEAVRRISDPFKKRHSELPWKEMLGLRNFVIHEYEGVNLKVIWDTIRNDLPDLLKQINKLLKAEE
jgi:uncharacterized protein with HEPN domain